ncbi:hypothetical protein [Actinoplanes sp. GCM10030250]|uniref:hypothetical protein n=1 Tax=Actinoplanes sp. GCM10030250 TaxID=3273376 RepID=UPI00360C0518
MSMNNFGRDAAREVVQENEPGAGKSSRWAGFAGIAVALATVITGIAAVPVLWPDPDIEDSAKFISVRFVKNIALSEYRQRVSPPRAAAMTRPRVAAYLVEPSDEPEPTDPPDDDGGASEPAEPSLEPPVEPSSEGPVREPARSPSAGGVTSQIENECFEQLAAADCTGYVTTVAALMMLENTAPNGVPLPPDQAAAEVATVVKSARKAARKPGKGKRRETLGVVVTAEVELGGLRKRQALVSWSMWQQDGGTPLNDRWRRSNAVVQLTAGSNRDTASFDFWVPLPKARGEYFIRSAISVGGSVLASADTTTFA